MGKSWPEHVVELRVQPYIHPGESRLLRPGVPLEDSSFTPAALAAEPAEVSEG